MKYFFVVSPYFNPYYNLAYEDFMFNTLKADECLFYLWQNHHTVVIGKNQNAFKECKVSELEANGGYVARRSSGGGAVYHDRGNLNFTFIAPTHSYNLEKNLKVIIEALATFNIHATFSGRNDIEVAGFKVSGNAFASNKTHTLHHGTLLVDVKIEELSRFLMVSHVKLASKGVESVRKRVKNLKDFSNEITVDSLLHALPKAYHHVFETDVIPLTMQLDACQELINHYSSHQFRLEPFPHYEATLHKKFTFGEMVLFFNTTHNTITTVKVFTDSLDRDIKSAFESFFITLPFTKSAMLLASANHEYEDYLVEVINELFMS